MLEKMRLINRCSCRRSGAGYVVQDQVRQIVVVLACLLGHLALLQLADASEESSSSSASSLELSLPLGNGNISKKGTSRGQAVISSVPKEDRGMFIVYHLARALNSAAANESGIILRTNVEPEIPQKKFATFKDVRPDSNRPTTSAKGDCIVPPVVYFCGVVVFSMANDHDEDDYIGTKPDFAFSRVKFPISVEYNRYW